ncbi:protein kintoun [Trichogramma pretiosum]|uniref:protein kintoun n=1 Tax=Trichogramma pretiosum TaxID=7493 RepID=UPI0006C98525|nr:protein kintoun [Trichogramma pretiosum]XP_014224550.1 protein kintoun [Trichogramma pretiosum]XP_023318844.1 protein kintoun [Trichogramma pretiosum]
MESFDEERREAWENLNVSRDEMRNLTECLKKDEFRKLLMDYAEEVNDPENRRLYEQELTQLERERGIDVTFVKPEAAYVIKTSLDGRLKCFINVGGSECVAKPTSRPAEQGLDWSIPYVLAPPRDDFDKSKVRCMVYDVVFHPDTLYLAEKNPKFREIVNETALDGVESNFKVKLDRKNLKFPKMSQKGTCLPTVIRKPCEKPKEKLDIDPEIYQKLMSTYDENRKTKKKSSKKPERTAPQTKYYNKTDDVTEMRDTSSYTTPKFIIKYQSSVEMDEFLETKDAKLHSTTPKNLVIVINLPLLKSASNATLDVKEQHLTLKSEKPAKYNLELPLSYRVDKDKGNAKFDPKSKKLTVTLPVLREASLPINTNKVSDAKEDSGVDSDHGSPLPESEMSRQLKNEGTSDLVEELHDIDTYNVNNNCVETVLRTSLDEATMSFMNPNLKYSLPTFSCNLHEDVLGVTIHAKNVDSDAIQHKILANNAGFHVIVSSIGAGFYPVYYSLCLKLENQIQPDTLNIEPWDNNVVVSVKLDNPETISKYLYGISEESMESKNLSEGSSIKNKLRLLTEDSEVTTDKEIKVIPKFREVVINVGSQKLDSDDEGDYVFVDALESQEEEPVHRSSLSRSVSESSGDELPSSVSSSVSSGVEIGRYKSIYKSRSFSRSISESSIDDSIAQSPSITFTDSVHEFNSESEGSSLKKTVRFSDVVSQKLYRSNSSILGQRRKNQRKRNNKKRAQERRMSESECSETEEREKYKNLPKTELGHETAEAVRPILLHRNNRTEAQKTANIDIQGSSRNANMRKQKRNTDTLESNENVKTDNHSDVEFPL